MATFDDFMKLDIRVGTIIEAKVFEKARNIFIKYSRKTF
jgi:tRNA-binding EMAP/Myf-like protein